MLAINQTFNEFVLALETIVNTLLSKRKSVTFDDVLVQECVDRIKFCKSDHEKRISIFLCCTLIQIETRPNVAFIKRMVYLSDDLAECVRIELAYQSRKLFKLLSSDYLALLLFSVNP